MHWEIRFGAPEWSSVLHDPGSCQACLRIDRAKRLWTARCTKCQAFFKNGTGSVPVEFSFLAFYGTQRTSSLVHDLAREAPWTAAACWPHQRRSCIYLAPTRSARAQPTPFGKGAYGNRRTRLSAPLPKQKTPPGEGRGGGRSRQRLTGIPGRRPRWCCGRTGGCRRAPDSSRPCRRALPRASARCTCRAWPRRRRVRPCR